MQASSGATAGLSSGAFLLTILFDNLNALEARTMYAIIIDGGRQYKVIEGQELVIDYREASAGEAVQFDEVVACGEGADLKLGQPTLKGAKVTGKILEVVQGPKLVVQKARRRKTYRAKTGHRQMFTKVQIDKIIAG
jgi:large subunit ribosomal protein L21